MTETNKTSISKSIVSSRGDIIKVADIFNPAAYKLDDIQNILSSLGLDQTAIFNCICDHFIPCNDSQEHQDLYKLK